jgi:CHASE2 domain-containing sensor protein
VTHLPRILLFLAAVAARWVARRREPGALPLAWALTALCALDAAGAVVAPWLVGPVPYVGAKAWAQRVDMVRCAMWPGVIMSGLWAAVRR